MDQLKLRIAFNRGFYDARDGMPQPSVDYAGDPELHKAWEAGRKHFDTLVSDEATRLEEATKSGDDSFPMW